MLFGQHRCSIDVVSPGPAGLTSVTQAPPAARDLAPLNRVPPSRFHDRASGGRGRCEASASAGGDLDVDRGADLGVQPDPDLVRAHGLDRVADLDPAPVELGAAGGWSSDGERLR